MSSEEERQRRRQRFRNKLAKDLRDRKYHQRRVPNKKKEFDDEREYIYSDRTGPTYPNDS